MLLVDEGYCGDIQEAFKQSKPKIPATRDARNFRGDEIFHTNGRGQTGSSSPQTSGFYEGKDIVVRLLNSSTGLLYGQHRL